MGLLWRRLANIYNFKDTDKELCFIFITDNLNEQQHKFNDHQIDKTGVFS